MTSRRPFLLLRISFPGRPIFIQFVPELLIVFGAGEDAAVDGEVLVGDVQLLRALSAVAAAAPDVHNLDLIIQKIKIN